MTVFGTELRPPKFDIELHKLQGLYRDEFQRYLDHGEDLFDPLGAGTELPQRGRANRSNAAILSRRRSASPPRTPAFQLPLHVRTPQIPAAPVQSSRDSERALKIEETAEDTPGCEQKSQVVVAAQRPSEPDAYPTRNPRYLMVRQAVRNATKWTSELAKHGAFSDVHAGHMKQIAWVCGEVV